MYVVERYSPILSIRTPNTWITVSPTPYSTREDCENALNRVLRENPNPAKNYRIVEV